MIAWTDRQVEEAVARLLRIGVMAAAAVTLVGGLLFLWQAGGTTPDYRVFRGEPAALRSPAGILRSALAIEPRGVIELGILLLVATPIARVAFSMWAFVAERDLLYVVITLIVLTILTYSLFWGH